MSADFENSKNNPGEQRAIRRDEYDHMSPHDQGYVSYMQSAWNEGIPEECPYGSDQPDRRDAWLSGNEAAAFDVMDCEG